MLGDDARSDATSAPQGAASVLPGRLEAAPLAGIAGSGRQQELESDSKSPAPAPPVTTTTTTTTTTDAGATPTAGAAGAGAVGLDVEDDAGKEAPGQAASANSAASGLRQTGCATLPTIVFSQFAGTSLWFAPNAVVAQVEGFREEDVALLTSLVQVGFIVGTFTLTYFALADRFAAPALFAVMSLLGAVFNALCVATTDIAAWAVLRTLVGFTLAGVYPVGMKIAAKQYPDGLGARLGVLIAALTLGTAFPWLIRGVGDAGSELPFETTLVAVSLLALAGAVLMPLVLLPRARLLSSFGDLLRCRARPGAGPTLVIGWESLREIMSSPAFRAASFGYWGHMWELYALWAHAPALIRAHAAATGTEVLNVPLTTFVTIGVGALSSALAGVWSLRAARGDWLPGSAVAAIWALAISGACCLVAPAYSSMSGPGFLVFMLVWGSAVIADSGQFSTLCARYAPPHLVGTALTLTTCVGFAITVVSIQLVGALLRAQVDAGLALLALVAGPIVGLALSYPTWPLHRLVCGSKSKV